MNKFLIIGEHVKKALEENVISKLLADGFVGKYPHYRKVYSDRIELISFPKYKYGNAFYVLASVAYPSREREMQNVNYRFFNGNFDELITDDCRSVYSMKGNFGELFYYTDVYWRVGDLCCMGISEEKAKTYKRKWYELRLQKADENIYKKVCDQVNKKLPKIYKWWARQ